MMRLSLETVALLPILNETESKVIEDIFNYHMFDMMFGDVRLASYYDASLDKIQLLPLKEEPMTTKKETTEKKTGLGQKVVDVINVLSPTMQAMKAWIKAMSKWEKN
jgi:hypothetical protein